MVGFKIHNIITFLMLEGKAFISQAYLGCSYASVPGLLDEVDPALI